MKAPVQRRKDWIRRRREKRKLTRHARVRRQVLRYSLLLGLVLLGICGFTRLPWALSSVHDDVQIHGNKVVSDEQVQAALRGTIGKPLFRVDPRLLEARVCALPAVKYAFVRRYVFPHPQLRVEVLEEFPWASFCTTADGPIEGVVAQTGRMIPLSQFPKVVQPSLRLCIPANFKMTPLQIAQWDSWVRLVAAQTGQSVSLIDLRNPTAMIVYCGDMELHVGAQDSTLPRRLGRLASVMPVADRLKDKVRYIDLSLDSNIPLKVDKAATADAKEDQLLKEAAKAGGQGDSAKQNIPAQSGPDGTGAAPSGNRIDTAAHGPATL